MKSRISIPLILCGLILLVSGLRASAQDVDLGKLTADARTAHQKGDYNGAATLYKQALAIQIKTLGPNRPEVAASLNNLAVIYQDEYLYSQAEPLYQQALGIWEKTPRTDAQAASCMSNLADLYRDEHKDSQAEPLYNRALKIWAKNGQSDSPAAISALAMLGDIYHSQGQDDRAEPLYIQALGAWKKAGQMDKPNADAHSCSVRGYLQFPG